MKIVKSLNSDNGQVIKYLQKIEDNNIIETGYYDLDEHIICISSQVGCPIGCIFCSTTTPIDLIKPNLRFVRNLSAKEIVQQVKNVLDLPDGNKLSRKRILFSYMGMGEPLLNYDNVIESIRILSRDYPNSRATIATIGTETELMRKLSHEQFDNLLKLHLSLHAPNDELRKKILPKAESINTSLEALKYFSLARNVTCKVNYILVKDLNDSENHAIELAKLLQNHPFIVKLSNLNNFGQLESSDLDKFELFENILNSYGIATCRFFSIGTEIQAGCGQLRRHYYNSQS